jgi:glutamate racemase
MNKRYPIGVFDSGYGGLTVLKEIVARMPEYDYLYLGDNARAPYGPRSFESVYRYTLQCASLLFDRGCPLVILACNTASAKALRSIQQRDLPHMAPGNRILGVIRPTAEVIGSYSRSGHIGILGTRGTVSSGSYLIEIEKFFPELRVSQEACPMWVPLIEAGEQQSEGGEYFIRQHCKRLIEKDPEIDAIILACTHYPLIENQIRKYFPDKVRLLSQGPIVAESLREYLARHPEMAGRISRHGKIEFLTTDEPDGFEKQAGIFYGKSLTAEGINVGLTPDV